MLVFITAVMEVDLRPCHIASWVQKSDENTYSRLNIFLLFSKGGAKLREFNCSSFVLNLQMVPSLSDAVANTTRRIL